MDFEFTYNGIPTKKQIMNGVFYDADIDPSLSSETLTDSLKLTTNFTEPTTVAGVALKLEIFRSGSVDRTAFFYDGNSVDNINTNDESILMRPSFDCENSAFTYFTNLDSSKTYTSAKTTFNIVAQDATSGVSNPLVCSAEVQNYLPSIECKFYNEAGTEITNSFVRVLEDDIFTVTI
jgi:hypothetical protein